MTLQEYRDAYKKMSFSEVRKNIEKSSSFRQTTEQLYESIFHERLNHGCSNCWADAFVLLMTSDTKQLEKMKERKFELKAGALLRDVVNYDNDKLCTRHNLTDELALYHLRTHPSCIEKFSKYPENWEELAKASAEAPAEDENPDAETPEAPAEEAPADEQPAEEATESVEAPAEEVPAEEEAPKQGKGKKKTPAAK